MTFPIDFQISEGFVFCRYPTLNRWIQLQANLQSLTYSSHSSLSLNQDLRKVEDSKSSLKRPRAPDKEDSDSSSEVDERDELPGTSVSAASRWDTGSFGRKGEGEVSSISEETKISQPTSLYSLMFDWENEAPYAEAVQR